MKNLKGLYPIADVQCISTNKIVNAVSEVLSAGIKIIQYRDKTNVKDVRKKIAYELKLLSNKHNAILIINDDISLAKTIDADGVHIGKDDCTIKEAKRILGTNKIIGVSCYNKFENAKQAQEMGASYVAFGSFFNSPTKPTAPRASIELIAQAKKELAIPVCAIGGINRDNMGPLITAGVDMLAIISAIFSNPSPKQVVAEYIPLLQQFDLTA